MRYANTRCRRDASPTDTQATKMCGKNLATALFFFLPLKKCHVCIGILGMAWDPRMRWIGKENEDWEYTEQAWGGYKYEKY